MILMLMDDNNNTICKSDIDLQIDQISISSTVNIIFYSQILIALCKKPQRRFIEDIDSLNKLDKWYKSFKKSKSYNKCNSTDDRYNLVVKEIEQLYHNIAIKYGLHIKLEEV